MKEADWAKEVALKLHNSFTKEGSNYASDTGIRLIYANEISEYKNELATYKEMSFETDILVYEWIDKERWKPRVVIETKVSGITTHDAITYSKKSERHKFVHPYLRYGIFIGNMGDSQLPGRLFRHGENFDFMLSWKGYQGQEREWEVFYSIIKKEIEASRILEKMLFDSRVKNRDKYFALHRPLVVEQL